MTQRRIDPAERRARLGRRHRLAAGHRAVEVEDAARSLVCLHATDQSTVYLSAWARVDGFKVEDMDRALYEHRSLVKHMAMRRTLFVVPRDTLPVVQAAASQRVADDEYRRLIRDLEKAGPFDDPRRWVEDASRAVLDRLAAGEATVTQLRKDIPLLEGSIAYGEGKKWAGRMGVGTRLLTQLSAAGQVIRASNLAGWTTSRPAWALTENWLGHPVERVPEAEARAELVRLWLRAFGPGTERDIKWWLGSTLGAVRRALADIGAVEVAVESGPAYLLPDDLDPVAETDPWVTLLPWLDPTTMGWHERDWYLGPHRPQIFDSAGNAGPTIWVDGRIAGGWRQTESGDVVFDLLEDVGREAKDAVAAEAARLTAWLGGVRALPRFPSPLYRALS